MVTRSTSQCRVAVILQMAMIILFSDYSNIETKEVIVEAGNDIVKLWPIAL